MRRTLDDHHRRCPAHQAAEPLRRWPGCPAPGRPDVTGDPSGTIARRAPPEAHDGSAWNLPVARGDRRVSSRGPMPTQGPSLKSWRRICATGRPFRAGANASPVDQPTAARLPGCRCCAGRQRRVYSDFGVDQAGAPVGSPCGARAALARWPARSAPVGRDRLWRHRRLSHTRKRDA